MNPNLYIYTNGELKRKDDTLKFIDYSGKARDIPIERITDIYVMSELDMNTKLINFLGANGIAVHFFNYYSFYTGSYYPRERAVSGKLLVKQCEFYTDAEKRIELAREFVAAASDSMYRNMRYYNGRGKDLQDYMTALTILAKEIPKAKEIPELMGVEGNIHKVYYDSWNTIINADIDFRKRVRRPPDNMINTLISFINSMIYTRVLSEIYKTQLNPTISYLHEPGERRFSLSLDIAEIFKPLVGDRLIFSLLNRKQISEKSFTEGLEGLHLKKEASQTIIRELDEYLKRTIKHKTLGREVSYQYLMRLECYKLIKHLIGEKKYEGFRIWW